MSEGTAVIEAETRQEVADVDMESQSNVIQPGTSKSFEPEFAEAGSSALTSSVNDQTQQSSNLFSALKFWMAKRVDSLNTSSGSNKNLTLNKKSKEKKSTEDMSIDVSLKMDTANPNFSDASDLISRRKIKKKLKTIKSM